jgi:hypothetical protein
MVQYGTVYARVMADTVRFPSEFSLYFATPAAAEGVVEWRRSLLLVSVMVLPSSGERPQVQALSIGAPIAHAPPIAE